MAWTQADIVALKAQLGLKALTTRHGDTMVAKEYYSLQDMLALLDAMEAEVLGAPEPARRTVAAYRRGL